MEHCFFSRRGRHTRCALVTGVQTCALPIFRRGDHGKDAHGAMPHLGIDPVFIAAQVVTALQGLVARTVDPLDSAVLSVTRMEGGSVPNVIPRSEVRRFGNECVRPCRSRWSLFPSNQHYHFLYILIPF